MKIIGRISKLNMAYANLALKGTALNQIEEFGILHTIKKEKNPKKSEVIYANLFELSSGTDMLNRLRKSRLIKEYNDREDKRSKRIEKNTMLLLGDLADQDKQLCTQLLKNVEIKFSGLWQKHKGKNFDDIYQELAAGNKADNHPR